MFKYTKDFIFRVRDKVKNLLYKVIKYILIID